MEVMLQELVLTNIKVLGVINLLIIAVAMLHRAYKAIMSEHSARFQEELWPRVESYLKSASTARHIPTIDVRPNERQHVFDVLLSYAQYYELDLHEIFDINGFTRERIEKLWTRKNAQLLRELAIMKSPQAQDLLFARLAETSGEEAYRVAYALSASNLNDTARKRLLKTMLKASINVERCVEIIASLDLPAEILLEALYEQESPYGEKIMLSALALRKDLDQDWIVEDVRPYMFHSRDVAMAAIEVLGASGLPYAFDLLRDEYFNNPSWEVRASIARVMVRIEPYYSIPMLEAIAADQAWWVQFNAMAALARMGPEGREAIRALARDSLNPVATSLARQVLDIKPARPRFESPVFSESRVAAPPAQPNADIPNGGPTGTDFIGSADKSSGADIAAGTEGADRAEPADDAGYAPEGEIPPDQVDVSGAAKPVELTEWRAAAGQPPNQVYPGKEAPGEAEDSDAGMKTNGEVQDEQRDK